MRPKNVYVIRHGLSLGNVDGCIHDYVPDWAIDLTTMGECQALVGANKILADALHDNGMGRFAVYISPYNRTRQTWAAMKTRFDHQNKRDSHSAYIKFVHEDPRLREQEWGGPGAFRDSAVIEREREEYGPFYYRILNGESGSDVYDRCTMFLDTLYRDFEDDDYPENVVIVTHGFTMRALVMRWIHASVEEFHSWKNPDNCQVVTLRRYDDKHFGVYEGFKIRPLEKSTIKDFRSFVIP